VKPRPAARINGGFKLLRRWRYQAGHLIKSVEVARALLRMRGVAYVIYPTSIAVSLEHRRTKKIVSIRNCVACFGARRESSLQHRWRSND
jgi:hypothetical protein